MSESDAGTLLGRLVPASLDSALGKRLPRLVIESLVFTGIALYLALLIGFEEPGLVSIFLVSASLSERIRFLLNENRHNVWESNLSSWQSNKLTALSFLAIFMGIITAYFIYAFGTGVDGILQTFGFVVEASGLGEGSLLTRQFSSFQGILSNNLTVLLCISILAFIYRAYGAMLALSWNACVWAAAIAVLTLRTAQLPGTKELSDIIFAATALLPHLILEGFAYIIGALAAIFLSQGISKYPLRDPRFVAVGRACFFLLLIAITTVAIGSAVESSLVPYIFSHL